MCIAVFMWKSHPRYPFLLLLNRDEFHNRETTPLHWWEGGEILAGKDERSGGTWLAISKHGKIAFLTNVREDPSNPQLKTRGDLPIRFLKSEKSPKDFAEELIEEAAEYNGFNLVVGDFLSMSMFYITNRPKKDKGLSVTEVSTGVHVLSNAALDTQWRKALRLRHGFEDTMKHCESDVSLKEITEKLMNDTTKDEDTSELPGIYPPQFESRLSSIFVEADTPTGRYGTRSTSAIAVGPNLEIEFYDRSLGSDQLWTEETVIFRMSKGSC